MAANWLEQLVEVLEEQRLAGQERIALDPEWQRYLFGDGIRGPAAAAGVAARPAPARPATAPAPSRPPTPAPARSPAPPPPRPPAPAPVVAAPAPPAAAFAIAAPPLALDGVSWESLAEQVHGCQRCGLCAGRTQTVFGEGDTRTPLMFIGEGPGAEEDRTGRPFVGAAGQLLDKMIVAMQFQREEVFIANVVKCRPPGNRPPEPEEAAACLPYLERQIELIRPQVIVTLGATPLRHLLGLSGITARRGKWLEWRGIPCMPTFHPSYLLRVPAAKKEVWSDLQQVMQRLGKAPPPRGTR